jgi:SulP family sulfate permease
MKINKIKTYFKTDFRSDFIAGIIVGLIALPLAIAFAVASGARPEQGIYTSIIAGLVIGLLSGSKYQIAGPTGAFVVILLGVVNKFGMDGLMLAGFMAGIILLLFGIFKFGSAIKYIPYPVVIGFTAGIGVTIFSGEIKDFFGLHFDKRPDGFVDTIHMVVKNTENGFNISAVIIGLVTIIAWILWKRYSKTFPPAPIALAAGIITSIAIELFFSKWLPKPILVGLIPSGLPEFHMLNFSLERIEQLFPSAFTIAMLGAIESLLSAVVADGMTGTKHNSNKELMAQGIGNMILPFFGGIPATGAIARTAANIKSGARTRASSIIHAITLLLIMLVFGTYAQYIPLSALAEFL